eukprot:2995571-Prymnesium_polylepis.1
MGRRRPLPGADAAGEAHHPRVARPLAAALERLGPLPDGSAAGDVASLRPKPRGTRIRTTARQQRGRGRP